MKRNFCIGSSWLYYKIYTGVKTADLVLLEKIGPIISDLKEAKLIDKWFFIRYRDPHEHIRIRFHCEDSEILPIIIIAKLYPVLNELMESDIVWKVQTDTYQREMERYGEHTIEDSETVFWLDSEMVLKYLSLKSSFINEETQLLFSFLAIDRFLNSFSLSNKEKLLLLDDMQLSFKKEFDADKTLRKELDRSYRTLDSAIQSILSENVKDTHPEIYSVVLEKQNQANAVMLSIKEKLQIPLSGFLSGHIHMMINRQYTSKQRMYEAVIYDHLYRYYKMMENRYRDKNKDASSAFVREVY